MARGFIADFLVRVSSTGFGRTKKEVDQLGKSTHSVRDAHIAAARAAREHYNTQEKGIIGTANSTKSFSKLAQTMNQSSGIVGAYATLAANIFAVTAAFNALRNAAQVQQVQAGLEEMGARMGLTLSVAAKNVKEISNYTLSTEQAMRSTAQVMAAGLGTDTLERLTQVAQDTSFALGRNMTDSMDRLTRGIVKLEPELLDELGLMTKLTEASNSYANAHGKSAIQLTNFEKRQAFSNAILAEGKAKFEGISEAAENTRNLDILAATFSNLTTQVLKLINTAILPLAGLLGSKGILFGGMILFAGTIRRQLLPGLANMAQSASRTAEDMKELAVAQAQGIKESHVATNRFFTSYVNKVEKGKDASKQFAKAQKQLTEDIIEARSELQKPGLASADIVTLRQMEREATKELGILRQIETARLRANRATLEYAAIGEASNRKFGASWQYVKLAVKSYSVEVALASTQTSKFAITSIAGLAKVRVAWYAVTLSARVLGAALLNLIPIIGQVILVISLLVEGFNYLRDRWTDPDIKKFNEALNEQAEILNNVSKTVDNVNRVARSDVSIRIKEQQIWTALGNSVKENIDAYQDAAAARDKAFAPGTLFKLEETPEYRTLNILTKAYPQALEQVKRGLEARGIDRNILTKPDKMLSTKELKALADVINNDLAKGLPQLGLATEALGLAFDATSKAINEFNRSAIHGTPYDQIVNGFNSMADSMYEAAEASIRVGDVQARMANELASAPQEVRNFLSPNLQETISSYEKLESKIREIQRAGGEIPKTVQDQFHYVEKVLALRSSELLAVRQQFVEAQNIARMTQSQIQLEQARLNKLNSYTAVTAAAVRKRREAENHILQLQINQLKTQQTIIANQIRQQQIQQTLNKLELQRQEIMLGLVTSQDQLNKLNNVQIMRTGIQRTIELTKELNEARAGRGQRSVADIQKEINQWADLVSMIRTYESGQNAISELQASTAAIGNQIRAQQIGMTSQAVIAAEGEAAAAQSTADAREADNRIITEGLALRDTQLAIAAKEEGRVRSLAEEYNQMIFNQQKASQAAKSAATAQTSSTIAQLKLERQRAQEQNDPASVAVFDGRIAQQQRILEIQLAQIDATNRLNILEKFAFDTQSEGLRMQQESLEYAQKYLDVTQETVEATRRSQDLDRQIARRRSGRNENEFDRQADEIRAARDAYALAVREANIRKSVITLEFALLEARRQQLLMDMQARRTIVGANTEMGQQLTAVINNLERSAGLVEQARDAALQGVDQSVENARKALQLALLPQRGADSIGSVLRSLRDLQKERAAGRGDLGRAQPRPVGDVHISPFIKSQDSLRMATEDLTAVNRQLVEQAGNTPAATASALSMSIQEAAAHGVNEGFRISEMAGYGGVGGGHRGAGHREGRAFDLNIGRGNREWDDPQMKARMDALAKYYRDLGFTVLWGVKGHFDHMHVEIPKGVTRVAREAAVSTQQAVVAPVAAVGETAVKAIEKIEEKVPEDEANSDIVVTGRRRPPTVGAEIQNAIEGFAAISQTGPVSILTVFEEMADKLGPEGEIIPIIIRGINSIGEAYLHLRDILADPEASFADRLEGYAKVAMAAINTISSLVQASADAKVANIDREIAAEQRRDGKSAESVQKIQALERKKDAIQRKAFNTDKKLKMASAIIATATGVAQALSYGPIVGPILAAVIAALGAAQLAIIAGTSYQSTTAPNMETSTPDMVQIGRRGDTVDLARNNPNAGGEIGYLRGAKGYGKNASDYYTIGSAYGGPLPRGYSNTAFVVGEKGPEIMTPETPITVRPINNREPLDRVNQPVNFNIQALDAKGIEEILLNHRGNIIGMLREAANANGETFLEDVNTNVYTSPRVSRL